MWYYVYVVETGYTHKNQEEYNMNNHIESLNNYLNDNGFIASIWQNRRVYINGYGGKKYDKDIKAYIDIDEPFEEVPDETGSSPVHPLMAGCALKVFSNADQERQWLINRAKQFKRNVAVQLHEVGLVKEAPPEDWREMI